MVSEPWKQIEQIYYSVVASSVADRGALLNELCSNDPDMRREVESLLNARDDAGNFLSSMTLKGHIAELLSEPDLTGQTLGHYLVLSAIGAGAMGKVYLARDTRLDRQVALKILPTQFTQNADRVARFRREAKAASALNHPNIITIYDVGEIGDTSFIAAEFIEGVTLRERLAAGRMELPEVLAIGVQCALALEAAHQAGIVHRDIKPENIMVRPDGLVKVLDFGVARMETPESAVDATQAGTLVGTPRYMSPEQARGQNLDARTDIFSLGAVLYEMAIGVPAFPGATTAEVFAALLGATPCAPSECVPGIPANFDAIILKALEKDPPARQPAMQTLAADLEDFGRRPAIPNKTPDKKRVTSPARASLLRRRSIVMAAAVLGAGFALTWYTRMAKSGSPTEAPTLSAVPLTSFEGFKDFGSFSPDGTRTAFSWNGGRGGSGGHPQRNIYIKTIGPDEPVQLTFAPEDEGVPVWSPDGQMLAMAGVPGESSGIFLQSFATGERRRITNPPPHFDTLPVFSPDGQWIAFTRDFGFSSREIFVVSVSGGTAKQLTFDHEPTYGAAWTPDSREIVFSSNRGVGGEGLWRIPATGGVPRRVSATLQGAFYPSISRQGNRLVYTESFKDTNIYACEGPGFGSQPGTSRTALGRFGAPKGLILSSRRDDSPSISPDGERIAFVSKRTGNEEIWIANRNGGQLVQLTAFKGPGTGTPQWSPDGQRIAFDSLAGGNPDIYVIDAGGGTPRRLTNGSQRCFMPSWSPDGQWVYFKSATSGSNQIWKIPAAGGVATQLTQNGGGDASASPDGKMVYFRKRSWGPIWMVPAEVVPRNWCPSWNALTKSSVPGEL